MSTDLPAPPRRRPKRLRAGSKPKLTVAQILAWADAHYKRTGKWPRVKDGRIGDAWDTTWTAIDSALTGGWRGLIAGSSLARLLNEHRAVRNRANLPPFSVKEILVWADAHRLLTGSWPKDTSGPVKGAAGETWNAVESALLEGIRGLPGGSSLAKLLDQHRGVRNHLDLPRLTIPTILKWADAHFKRTGRWPRRADGAIVESPGDSWLAIDACLIHGRRGLACSTSLAQLLDERRGVRNHRAVAAYTERRILAWADDHFRRAGKWPKRQSGPVIDAPGETWAAVEAALSAGTRGLPGGSSLAQLLQRRRGVRNVHGLPPLRVPQILAWARAYRRRAGKLPANKSEPIVESPSDTWLAVDMALRKGNRGLPGGSSLAKLLKARLGASAEGAGRAK